MRHRLVPRRERAVDASEIRAPHRGARQRRSSSNRLRLSANHSSAATRNAASARAQVEVARAAQRHVDFVHRAERHAQQHVEALALRLDEGLHADVGRNVVRAGRPRRDDGQHREKPRQSAR
jgi:hypothetical protein